ncbi:MAG TPA: hypothetical protein VFP78_17930 [Solirubrobacteraceae bacterium]|nr:hypothetical protein [Solirubrobacteraceae bacterium]
MFNRRITRTVAVTLALGAVAVAAPSAVARPIDSVPSQNLRGADAQGAPTTDDFAGRGTYQPVPADDTQDLRHADTRDYAEGRGTHTAPDVVVVKAPAAEPVATGGVDWEHVGIGAGGMLSLALIGAGGTLVAARRRSVRLAG